MIVKFFLFAAICVNAINASYDENQSSDSKTLFFIHNNRLFRTIIDKHGIDTKLFIDETVLDYCLDEVYNRIFWVDGNNEVFYRQIHGSAANHKINIFKMDSETSVKIAYDANSEKLYVLGSSSIDLVIYTIQLQKYKYAIVDYEFLDTKKHKVWKVVLNPDAQQLFMLYELEGEKHIYRMNTNGTNKTDLISNVNAQDFDVDFKSGNIFLLDQKSIKALTYDAKHKLIVLNDLDSTSLSIDDYELYLLDHTAQDLMAIKICLLADNLDLTSSMRARQVPDCRSIALNELAASTANAHSLKLLRKAQVDRSKNAGNVVRGARARSRRQLTGLMLGLSKLKGQSKRRGIAVRRRNRTRY